MEGTTACKEKDNLYLAGHYIKIFRLLFTFVLIVPPPTRLGLLVHAVNPETPTAMATETRSHHGCWSCRLRKKKCDERHPICTECMCVGLECHGFGERPEWMDRGARQKAQAAKMKQKVAQVTKSRRMNQIRDQHESSMKRQQKQNNTNNDANEANSKPPMKSSPP